MSDIGITMIGHSSSGKTCYLYAMYSQMAFGVNGFTFIPEDYDQGLDLEDGWGEIVDDGKWPKGTDFSTDYVFDCSHSFRKLLTFEWHDYRGGLLRERSDERKELFVKLQESSCLILCISSEMLIGVVNNDPKVTRELGRYNAILNEFCKEIGNTVPIALTITKSDLIEHDQSIFVDGINILKQRCFKSLFTVDGNWLVMIVPVSLGIGLENEAGNISGTISPKNIHLPVMFAIYSTFNRMLGDALALVNSYSDSLNAENEKSGWKKFWKGDDTTYYREKLQESNANLDSIKKDLNKIINELKDNNCLLFYNGEKQSF